MNQTLITDYYPLQKDNISKPNNNHLQKDNNSKPNDNIVYGYNVLTASWHCMECGIDMGSSNPRQLCGKNFCWKKL